jgi:hypothetical protein
LSTKKELVKATEELALEGAQILKQIKDDLQKSHSEFVLPYQKWYTKALAAVAILAPGRLAEFKSYYEPDPKRKGIFDHTYRIRDFIGGSGPSTDDFTGVPAFNGANVLRLNLYAQVAILHAAADLADSRFTDIEQMLAAEIEDRSLTAAQGLMRVNLRAAGALAGVVMEEHLQRVASQHGISIKKKNPTIADLNDPLKDAAIYDVATWRRIQYLADIRNKCAHKKSEEPTKAEVEDLLSGASWLSKSIQ